MRELTNCSPERVAMRARAKYTRADIVTDAETNQARGYSTFYAVYTTPEGEVADKIYCYSDSLCGDRLPPGQVPRPERIRRERMQEALGRMLGDKR